MNQPQWIGREIRFGTVRTRSKSAINHSLLAAVFLLSACGGSTTLVSTPLNDVSTTSTAADEEQSSDGENSGGRSVDSEIGSRERPAPIGSVVLIKDADGNRVWEVELVESSLNVNSVIANANMFNSAPPAGFQFARATVKVTYLGPAKGLPGSDLTVAFVSAAGTTHKTLDIFVVGPQDLSNVNELYPGATSTASVYIAIPTFDAEKGTWRVSAFLNNEEFHFSAS